MSQQISNVLTAGQRLIQKAQDLGSSAKTVRGALAYLRSQHTPAIPGLAALGKLCIPKMNYAAPFPPIWLKRNADGVLKIAGTVARASTTAKSASGKRAAPYA